MPVNRFPCNPSLGYNKPVFPWYDCVPKLSRHASEIASEITWCVMLRPPSFLSRHATMNDIVNWSRALTTSVRNVGFPLQVPASQRAHNMPADR